MVTFSAEIRASVGADATFNEIEERYRRCRELRISYTAPGDLPIGASLPLKIGAMLDMGLLTALHLTELFVVDLNAGRFEPSAERAGALLETARLMKEWQLKVESVMREKNTRGISPIERFGLDALLQSKSLEWLYFSRRQDVEHLIHPGTPSRTTVERVKVAASTVALSLLLITTAIERYQSTRRDFVRLWEDLEARGGA